ncbi:MAG: retron St85 family effector protein [Pseudomonadota bacterium]
MEKVIKEFAEALDLARSKVKQGPSRVSVFGGKTESVDGKRLSQRGTFLLAPGTLVDYLVVPEHFKNWNHFGTYNDLLSFEEDVCSLVDTVLVFLESAGAIAEFAAFIKHKEIAAKLLIVFNGKEDTDSFIRLGLIRYLEQKFPNSITVITSKDETLSRDEANFIIEEISGRLASTPKIATFSQFNTRHWLYLIVDFIDLMQVARISDIQIFLATAGFIGKKKRIEQLLLALKNVGLVRESPVLSERCFSLESTVNLVDYAFTPGSTSKRVSWKAKFFMEMSDDRWRNYAYKQLKLAPTEEQSNAA